MPTLYSYKGAFPYPLPDNLHDYSTDDFLIAPEKPSILPDEVIEWNGINWVVRKSNAAETAFKEAEIRQLRNSKLAESDLFVIRAYEQNIPVSNSVIVYRQELRDITQNAGFPWAVSWPASPTN